jgi:hypothetical protein
MSARRPTLDEPIQVASFWKNRRHDAVVISLQSFQGRNLVDVRMHAMHRDGTLKPTGKGVAMVVLRLPELLAAVTKAHAKAVELGLLDEGEAE